MTTAREWLQDRPGVDRVVPIEKYLVTKGDTVLTVHVWHDDDGYTVEVDGMPRAAAPHVGETRPTLADALEQVREDFLF